MFDIDVDLGAMRLQYEILNIPVEQLAKDCNMPIEILKPMIDGQNWKQWWPDNDFKSFAKTKNTLTVVPSSSSTSPSIGQPDDDDSELDPNEEMSSEAENFITRSKKRLAVYAVAKEILLAQRMFELERKIIKAANDCLDSSSGIMAKDAKALSDILKNLMSNSVSDALASVSIGQDEGGLPTVIIKDLSGKKK